MREIRKDIQGLRALAVLSVVLYHFNSNYAPSGFAGVDVFFVISGFLMTSIIYKGLSNNTFDLMHFYISRAKRIAPALCVVVLILLAFGFIFIEPMTLQQVGKHSLSSMLFYSNYTYFNESGYFDQSSREKFLLHTWSLSVEWQFYIIYPVLIVAFKKLLPSKDFRVAILTLMIVSFLICLYIKDKNPSYAYFMIATRAWEMMLGGVVFLYPLSYSERNGRTIEISGLVMVIISFFAFDESTAWPGISSLVPTLGAALVISANVKRSILSANIFQFIGKISYSMYLVHWVILVAIKKMYFKDSIYVYLPIVLVSSVILYIFIERRRNFGWLHFIAYCAVIIASYYTSLSGANWRIENAKEFMVDSATYRLDNEGHNGVSNSRNPIYFNSNEGDFDYILIGSSHARHYYHYIENSKHKVASLALDGCDSTKNYYSKSVGDICEKRYSTIIEFIKKHLGKKIIWATVWNEPTNQRNNSIADNSIDANKKWQSEITEFLNDIKDTKSQLYLIGDTPGSKKIMFECLAKNALPINRLLNTAGCEKVNPKVEKPINETLISLSKKNDNVHFIDASMALCHGNECNVILDGSPVYTDYSHLSKAGSDVVGEYIFNKIK